MASETPPRATTPEERERLIKERGDRLTTLESQVKRGQQAALAWALVTLAAMFAIGVAGAVVILLRTDGDAHAIITLSLAAFGGVQAIAGFIAGRITSKDPGAKPSST